MSTQLFTAIYLVILLWNKIISCSKHFEQNKVNRNINVAICLQDIHTAIVERYDNTLGKISDLTKKSEEYRDASDEMEKTVDSMPEIMTELQ